MRKGYYYRFVCDHSSISDVWESRDLLRSRGEGADAVGCMLVGSSSTLKSSYESPSMKQSQTKAINTTDHVHPRSSSTTAPPGCSPFSAFTPLYRFRFYRPWGTVCICRWKRELLFGFFGKPPFDRGKKATCENSK